jgi:hypothetical protein
VFLDGAFRPSEFEQFSIVGSIAKVALVHTTDVFGVGAQQTGDRWMGALIRITVDHEAKLVQRALDAVRIVFAFA